MFCKCPKITSLWQNLLSFISKKSGSYNNVKTLEKMFGVSNDTAHKQCINCLFLYLKFYVYRCRFQKRQPNFDAFMVFINYKQKIEYKIAEKRNKLGVHFQKWSFSIANTRPQVQSWFYDVVYQTGLYYCMSCASTVYKKSLLTVFKM